MEAPPGGYSPPGRVEADLAGLAAQHDEIFRHVHQVYALRIPGGGRLRLQLLARLLDLARANFAAEERVLAALAHPVLAAHQDSHRHIAEALAALCATLGAGRRVAQGDVASALAPLLVHHLKDDNVFMEIAPGSAAGMH